MSTLDPIAVAPTASQEILIGTLPIPPYPEPPCPTSITMPIRLMEAHFQKQNWASDLAR